MTTQTFSHEKVNVDRIRDLPASVLSVSDPRYATSISRLFDSNAIIVTRACVKRTAYYVGYLATTSSAAGLQDPLEGYPTVWRVFFRSESPKSRPSQEITACIIYQDPKCRRPHHPVVQSPSPNPTPPCRYRQLRSRALTGMRRARRVRQTVKNPVTTRRSRRTFEETARTTPRRRWRRNSGEGREERQWE